MDSLLLCAGLVILILLGMPIALAMIVLPAAYIVATGEAPLLTVPHQMFEAVAKLPLVAIPFFVLTGELMNSSAVTERILDLSRAIVGRMRGGLAQVNIVSSMFFAGMNGSAVADTATVGTVLIPAMKRWVGGDLAREMYALDEAWVSAATAAMKGKVTSYNPTQAEMAQWHKGAKEVWVAVKGTYDPKLALRILQEQGQTGLIADLKAAKAL